MQSIYSYLGGLRQWDSLFVCFQMYAIKMLLFLVYFKGLTKVLH